MYKRAPNLNETEVTSYNCAICSGPDHDDVGMVGCDNCSQWFHFKCVGVTEEVKDISWSCRNCEEKGLCKSVGDKGKQQCGENEPVAVAKKQSGTEPENTVLSLSVDELEKNYVK